jgi:hypothetical protein
MNHITVFQIKTEKVFARTQNKPENWRWSGRAQTL